MEREREKSKMKMAKTSKRPKEADERAIEATHSLHYFSLSIAASKSLSLLCTLSISQSRCVELKAKCKIERKKHPCNETDVAVVVGRRWCFLCAHLFQIHSSTPPLRWCKYRCDWAIKSVGTSKFIDSFVSMNCFFSFVSSFF